MPIWPAYREAIARGDLDWVSRTLRRSVAVTLAVSMFLSFALVALSPGILRLWVGASVSPTLPLLLGLGIGA